jgi:DNA-binding transcriptional LysR family regulator
LTRLQHLAVFTHVARHRNLTRAAQELNISQPSVSRQLKSLENWTGTKLFRKTNNGVELTDSGHRCLRYAEAIVSQVKKLEEEFGIGLAKSARAVLRVGGSHSPSMLQLPSLLTRFKQTHPKVDVSLRTTHRGRIEEMVLSSEVEIALVSGTISSPQLTVEPFRR